MEDDRLKARAIATEGLQCLAARGTSLEVPIEYAIRAAALLRHHSTRGYFELQLTDFDKSGAALQVRRALENALADDQDLAARVVENVVTDYLNSRTLPGTDKIWSNRIAAMEFAISNFEEVMRQERRAPPEGALEQFNELKKVFGRVKNRTQRYLTDVESGAFD